MTASRGTEVMHLLAQALIGSGAWPPKAQSDEVVRQALFHGIAGELVTRIGDWPTEVTEPLCRAAVSQAMWEVRHRRVLQMLLGAFSAAGVRVLLLKGSALAYDLYPEPAHRSRGDSDLLISRADIATARRVLSEQDFSSFIGDSAVADAMGMEEHWGRKTSDGLTHEIDLHWQALNSVALADVIPFETAWQQARPLPRLSPDAYGLPCHLALLLACAHRAKHVFTPYLVGEKVYFSGDRLIWLRDIDLLARTLDPLGWIAFEEAVFDIGLAAVALDGLGAAAHHLMTPLPEDTLARLRAAPQDGPADRYLLAGLHAERALRDLIAVSGVRNRILFLWTRLLPDAAFMRTKYPGLANRPLPLLYLQRFVELLLPRGRADR